MVGVSGRASRFTLLKTERLLRWFTVLPGSLDRREEDLPPEPKQVALPGDGLTMNLGVNPLLQFELKDTREKIIRNILNDISKVRYVPFDSETIGNPALDIGDVISFSGGHTDDTHAAITGMTVMMNGKITLTCVGKNLRLSQAKSKNNKNTAG